MKRALRTARAYSTYSSARSRHAIRSSVRPQSDFSASPPPVSHVAVALRGYTRPWIKKTDEHTPPSPSNGQKAKQCLSLLVLKLGQWLLGASVSVLCSQPPTAAWQVVAQLVR